MDRAQAKAKIKAQFDRVRKGESVEIEVPELELTVYSPPVLSGKRRQRIYKYLFAQDIWSYKVQTIIEVARDENGKQQFHQADFDFLMEGADPKIINRLADELIRLHSLDDPYDTDVGAEDGNPTSTS